MEGGREGLQVPSFRRPRQCRTREVPSCREVRREDRRDSPAERRLVARLIVSPFKLIHLRSLEDIGMQTPIQHQHDGRGYVPVEQSDLMEVTLLLEESDCSMAASSQVDKHRGRDGLVGVPTVASRVGSATRAVAEKESEQIMQKLSRKQSSPAKSSGAAPSKPDRLTAYKTVIMFINEAWLNREIGKHTKRLQTCIELDPCLQLPRTVTAYASSLLPEYQGVGVKYTHRYQVSYIYLVDQSGRL